MGNSGSSSSDFDKGNKFLIKFFYVGHVDDEMDTASDPDPYIHECKLADRTHFFDMNFTEYFKSPKANLRIISFGVRKIDFVTVYYSNPKPSDVPIHELIVFKTELRYSPGKFNRNWWSLERNGQQIILQQSLNKDDVINKIYDTEQKKIVERLGPIKKQKSYLIANNSVVNVLRIMWETNQISEPYHLLFSNCPNFASFVFGKLSLIGSTMTSAIVDGFGLKKKNIQPKIIAQQYLPENKKLFSFDGIDIMNDVNETGDTTLHLALNGEEWELAEEILNRFEIYDVNTTNNREETPLLLATKLKSGFGLFKKILNRTNSENINKADGNGWTALHYAVYKRSEIKLEELLKREDVDVNIINKDNNRALHLGFHYWKDIPVDLFDLILEKSKDINAKDEDGKTALHLAIIHQSEIATKKLLKHKDVDVNVKSHFYGTPLHVVCSSWKDIPLDLFKIILERSDDINAQDNNGSTALHFAIREKFEIATKALLAHSDVNVNIKNNDYKTHTTGLTALHLASMWQDIPSDLFYLILEKSTDINLQNIFGWTALHYAISYNSEKAAKALLAHKDVDVNIENRMTIYTTLRIAFLVWSAIPVDLFNLILEKSTTDNINAQDENGYTALHCAILFKSEIMIKKLLAHSDVKVNIKDNNNETALHLVSKWKDIPSDLLKLISERSTHEVDNISKMDRLSKYLRNLTVHK